MIRIKPMLAYPVSNKPIDWQLQRVYIQPKLDGVRCIIQANTKRHILTPDLNEIEVKAYSRTGKEWKNIQHILDELQPFFNKHPDVVLDGELYNHDLKDNFEKIISLVRKQKPTTQDRLDAAELIEFHCYDYIETVMNQPYASILSRESGNYFECLISRAIIAYDQLEVIKCL